MLTVVLVLAILALLISVAHGAGKAPLWPAVLILSVALLLTALPVK